MPRTLICFRQFPFSSQSFPRSFPPPRGLQHFDFGVFTSAFRSSFPTLVHACSPVASSPRAVYFVLLRVCVPTYARSYIPTTLTSFGPTGILRFTLHVSPETNTFRTFAVVLFLCCSCAGSYPHSNRNHFAVIQLRRKSTLSTFWLLLLPAKREKSYIMLTMTCSVNWPAIQLTLLLVVVLIFVRRAFKPKTAETLKYPSRGLLFCRVEFKRYALQTQQRGTYLTHTS